MLHNNDFRLHLQRQIVVANQNVVQPVRIVLARQPSAYILRISVIESRRLSNRPAQSLLRFARVVLLAVDIAVVFQGLQVSYDFGGRPQFGRQAFFQDCRQAVSFTDRCQAREQQVYFDDLAVPGRSEAYAMVLNGQFRANRIHLSRIFRPAFGSE